MRDIMEQIHLQGRREGMIRAAEQMLADGTMEEGKIVEFTGLPEDESRKLRAETTP